MGKLLQAVQNKINDLENAGNSPASPFKADPAKTLKDMQKRANASHIESELGVLLIEELRKLPKAKQDEFYDRCIQDERRGLFTKKTYDNRLDPNSKDGKTKKTWLISNSAFGQDWQKTVETLEEMIGPEAADNAAAKISELKTPEDLSFNIEDKIEYPHAAELEELKNSLPADASADRQLLDEVNEDLAVAKNSYLQTLDYVDGNHSNIYGMQTTMNGIHYDAQNSFIDGIENGKYKQRFPNIPSDKAKSGYFYGMSNVSASETGLDVQDIEALKQLKPDIPKQLKDDLIAMTDSMDKLGEDNFRVPGMTSGQVAGGAPGEQRFFSEQGTKYYAYWPLAKAREKLVLAVREKDMNKIREAHEAYRDTKKEMDGMLKTVRKHPTGICSGNINSTRPDEGANPVPVEHLEDFIGHSQVNGVFCLYAFSKNMNVPVSEVLEDPAAVLSNDVKKHIEKHGLNSKKTTGEKLLFGLSSTESGPNFVGQWSDTGMLCNRAFESIGSLAEDPGERERIEGTGSLAVAAASYELSLYAEKWKTLAEMDAEKRNVLYQYALLLPEDEFDPIAMADEFAKPDWKKRLDPGKLIDRMKKEGRLDVSKLAERVEAIVQQAGDADDAMIHTNYSEESMRLAAFNVYKTIEEKASPEERLDADLQRNLKISRLMSMETASFGRAQDRLFREFDTQKIRKSGWFLSSTDSQEHQHMVAAQDTLRYKIMQIQGQDLPPLTVEELSRIDAVSLKEACEAARTAAFDYCAKKTDNGTKGSFLHEAGENRYNAARESIDLINVISDEFGFRTPAQKAMDDEQLEILDNRSEESLTKDQAERRAAKLIYAMTLDSQPQSFDSQKKRLDPNRLEQGIAYIRGQAAFKEMFKKEGAAKITDHMVSGHGQLTDAYIRGMKSADEKQHGEKNLKDPKEMSVEEKNTIIKNTPLQM